MRPGVFELNKRVSSEFPCFIQHRPKKVKAQRVVDLTESTGVNGAIPFDKKYYKNALMDLDCFYLVSDIEEIQFIEDLITEWLDTRGQYVDFIAYWDPEYIYQVMVINDPEFSGTRNTKLGVPFSFSLSVKPFKLKIRGQDEIILTEPSEIYNPERYESDPEIKIIGNGDITVTINNENFECKDVKGHIIINSDPEIKEVYREVDGIPINENYKYRTREFPKLKPNKNNISFTGNVSQIEVKGRWQTKI